MSAAARHPASKETAKGDIVYLGFGSNLGDREANYVKAKDALAKTAGIGVLRSSSLFETPPMGPPQPNYLNGVIEIRCSLSPFELLKKLQRIEAALGRVRAIHWGPRTVDLDILFWGSKIVDTPELKIPHPGACERRFVLVPLTELAPDLVDPRSGRSVSGLLRSLKEKKNA